MRNGSWRSCNKAWERSPQAPSLRAFLQRIAEPELAAVFLCGFPARGGCPDTSDVDLLVLFDRPVPYPDQLRRTPWGWAWSPPSQIQPPSEDTP